MSRRKKNAGKGYGMMFHGAFGSKQEAKKKERAVHGFIQPRNIRGERRYVVMSERKNPRRKKNKARAEFVYAAADHTGRRFTDWSQVKDYAVRQAKTYGGKLLKMGVDSGKESVVRSYRKAGERYGYSPGEVHNPMELAVMGANPGPHAPREVVVHPGETITLKVNPSAAEEIREEFTGREADQVDVYDEPHMQAGSYSKLGDLMGITYKPVGGGQVQAIGWYEGSERIPLHEAAKTLRRLTEAPVLVSAENRRQLYFVSGNQDVSPLGVRELGEARSIVYRERKHFDDFALINYQHNFGEENGKRPTLFYDAGKKRLLLEGGDYEVRPEGITN